MYTKRIKDIPVFNSHETKKGKNKMVHELISKRYSTRAFADTNVEDSKIKLLFEAARWSPSSRNEQPWRFIYAEKADTEGHKKIADLLSDSNKIWAENAPLLILTIARIDSEITKQLNRSAFYDLGGAVANLTVQGISMGLFVHQMGGFNGLKARDVFSIPDNYEPVTILAVGYKGDAVFLPETLQKREFAPRIRKDLEQIVFREKFGQTIAQEDIEH